MTKKVKKLVLAKETLRSLSAVDLEKMVGGTYYGGCGNPTPSLDNFCNPSEITRDC
jgi:hypothetical protein